MSGIDTERIERLQSEISNLITLLDRLYQAWDEDDSESLTTLMDGDVFFVLAHHLDSYHALPGEAQP